MKAELIGSILAFMVALASSGTAVAQEQDAGSYVVRFAGNSVPNNAASIMAQAGGELAQALHQIGIGIATSDRSDFPRQPDWIDLHNHGTHVGGIVPAQSSNGVGISATGPIDAIGVEPDTVASHTDFGHSLVKLAAPGSDFWRFDVGDWFLDMVLSPCSRFSLLIPDCQLGEFFIFAAGTSMSAPHASDVAALIDSQSGGKLNASQLQTRLQSPADDLGKPGADPFCGHGRVNALTAVE